jgi:hypothetical protein
MLIGDRLGRVAFIIGLLAVAGCKGSSSGGASAASGSSAASGAAVVAPRLLDALPLVTREGALAATDTRLPAIIALLDEQGRTRVVEGLGPDGPADPARWQALATTDPGAAKVMEPGTLAAAESMVRDRAPTADVIAMLTTPAAAAQLAPKPVVDDPPPPPPEAAGEDESGGTGTAIALDEGKMGKKDSDRAEGEYKMPRGTRPDLIRDRAEAVASTLDLGPGFGNGPRSAPTGPVRVGATVGMVRDDRPVAAPLLIAPAAHAKATALRALLDAGRGLIAVRFHDTIRALRIDFDLRIRDAVPLAEDHLPWIEVRIGADALVLEAVPGDAVTVPWPAGGGDVAALRKAFDEVRAARGISAQLDADVLFGADTDVARLVDVLTALDAAGARILVLGDLPSADQARFRGARIAQVAAGSFTFVGGLTRQVLGEGTRAALAPIGACYAPIAARNHEAIGTVTAQFFITPAGTVTSVTASGVSGEVSACVAAAIKGLTFPKPVDGGGVQVNVPFDFWY